MRLRTTLILLGSTFALLGYILFHERHLENSREAAATSSRVNSFDPDEANVIRIEGPNGKSMFRKGKEGIWMMVHPVEDRADHPLLTAFVSQAADMAIVETMTLEEMTDEEGGAAPRPEDIGFGAEEIHVSISKGENPLATFVIGAPTEFEDVHYVRSESEWSDATPVLAVLSRLFDTAALPVDKLRDPHLVPAAADDLRQIKFAESPTSLMLKRERLSADGSAFSSPPSSGMEQSVENTQAFITPWRLTQPIDTRTDKQIVDDRIAALLGATIVKFSDGAAAPPSVGEIQDGKREIRVWTFTSKNKIIIELSDSPEAEAGDYLLATVTDRPGVLRISRDILKAFTVNPNELRDRHLADFKFETVLTVDIQGYAPDGVAEPPVKLARYGSNFALLRRGQKEKADADKIKELIRALNKEEVEFVADSDANPALYGLDRPLRLVSITTESPDPTAPTPPPGTVPKLLKNSYVLRIGEGPNPLQPFSERLYASFADTPFVYGISPELLGRLDPQAIRWKSPELLRFSLFDLRGITILRPPAPPIDIAYDSGTNGWTARAAGNDVSDQIAKDRVKTFGETLSFLVASGWTADPGYALQRIRDETILDITARIQDTSANKVDDVRIRIAPPSPGLTRSGTYYGQLNDFPDVFLIDRSTFNHLNANLLNEPESTAQPEKEDLPGRGATPTPAPDSADAPDPSPIPDTAAPPAADSTPPSVDSDAP